jgi:hypothetical protein
MDPFVESQRWQDFHTTFITVVREVLTPQIRPHYVVDVEEYVYVIHESAESAIILRPDVSVSRVADRWEPHTPPASSAVAVEPVVLTVPMPARIEQHYLVVRKQRRQDVVSVIELLSPWNKTAGDDRNEYLAKRSNIFAAHAHLIELDLLRGGVRLPTVEPLVPADFYSFLCRREQLPKVAVYAWSLRQPMPTVPVPLAGDDADVYLDLQYVFTTVYDRGGYDYALNYELEVLPPVNPADEAWLRGRLQR